MLTTITIFLLDMRQLGLQFMGEANSSPVLIDPTSDVSFGNGRYALTWRSYGQDFPVGATYLWTYRTDQYVDAGAPQGRILSKLVDIFPEDFDDIELIEAVVDITNAIERERLASATGQYVHSIEYFDLVHQLQFAHDDPYARFMPVDATDRIQRQLRPV